MSVKFLACDCYVKSLSEDELNQYDVIPSSK